MKKIILLLLTLCCMVSSQVYAKTNGEALDQIIAVVNDEAITQSELSHRIELAKIQITQERMAMPSNAVLRKQVLDQLINKKLQLQLAKQMGLMAKDDMVNKAIKSIADQNQMTVSGLYERINREGMSTTDYREEIREQMTLQRLQQQEVVNSVNISPDEVTNFLRSKSWQANISKEYHLQDILIPLSDTPNTNEIATARQRAQTIIASLNSGKRFQDIAQSESSGSNALQGGDLGWRKLPEIPSAFSEQVVKMKPNTFVGPIQTPNGFHIVRLEAVRSIADSDEPAPTRKQVEELLLQRKFAEAVQHWVSKLRSRAYVEIKKL